LNYLAINDQQQLHVSQTSVPEFTPSQCLIRVKAIGVNRADILQKQGKYPAPAGESKILGLEMAGEIVHIGARCQQWQVGQRVFGLVAGGAYAEFVAIEAEHIMPLPEHFDFVQGAASAEAFITAFQSLFTIAKLQAEQRVLIHAGASGVGTAAIQLAKAKRCYVVVTVGSEAKGNACLALGADQFINYHEQDFVNWTKQHVSAGYNVVLDFIADDYVNKNISVCALDGQIVVLAMLGGRYAESVDIAKMLLKRVSIHASTLRNRSNEYKTRLINEFQRTFAPALENGTIKPVLDSVFDWRDVEQAHWRMATNQNIGKIVLTLG
jgi:NADPH:quinone reductase